MSDAHQPHQAAGDQTSRPRGVREGMVYQALLLGAFTTIAGVLLVVGNAMTADAIVQREAEDLQRSLQEVVPETLHDNDLLASQLALPGPDGQTITAYRATRDGAPVAVAYSMSGVGYGGEIVLLMGVDANGRLLGVRVLTHSETPGLGDKIEAAKSDWIHAFEGRALGDPPPPRWYVKKDGGDFEHFSGATITARSVVGTVREGLEFFSAQRSTLLEEPASKQSDPEKE